MSDEIERDAILRLLAYTVLSDFTHMSEYHIKSTIVELAKRAEELCNMNIKTRASEAVIEAFWNIGGE